MCVAAGVHILGKDMQPQASRREESLGNSTVLGSLLLKESNSLGVCIVLGKVKGLRVHYIKMQSRSNFLSHLNLCLPNP